MSNTERNRATAVEFIASMRHYDGGDERLLTDDVKWVTANQVVRKYAEIKAHAKSRVNGLMSELPVITVTATTAEGDRVTVEAFGKCQLTNGKRYDNFYHFVLEFRDGRICTFKEYCDTKLASDAFGSAPLLSTTR